MLKSAHRQLSLMYRRSKFTTEDQKAILCGLLRDERYKNSGGNAVWREFEKLKVLHIHTVEARVCLSSFEQCDP